MLHYYAWYPKDWLTSLTRLEMSAAARGIYRDLLDYCYLDGSIPNDDEALQRLAAVSPAEWKRYSPMVRKQFFFGDDGLLHHRKVDEKRPECLAHYEQKVNAGRASGEARRERKLNVRSNERSNETSTDVGTKRELALTLTLPVTPPPTPSPNENGDFEFPEWFESVYSQWPLKGHREQALRALATHPQIGSPSWRLNLSQQAAWWSRHFAGQYAKKQYLFEWLNDEGWRYDPPVERERTATMEFDRKGRVCQRCNNTGSAIKPDAPPCPDPRDDEAAFSEWLGTWKYPCPCVESGTPEVLA